MRFTLLKQANIQLSIHSPYNWKRWPKCVLSQDISYWSNRSGKFSDNGELILSQQPYLGF